MIIMNLKRNSYILLLLCIQFLLSAPLFAANDITVEAMVGQHEVFVGEPFAMQIRINGTNEAEEPDLSHLKFFTIQPRGEQDSSNSQGSYINGSWQYVTNLSYTFSYILTPQQAGRLTIAPIPINVDGKAYQTNPITILAKKPQETEDFKLRTFLSANRCYVGEPITMTTTWFVGKDVNNFEFQLPILANPNFDIIPYGRRSGNLDHNELKIPIGDDTLVAEKKQGELSGKEYLTVTFTHLLIPKKTGNFTLPQATVSCQITTGFRNSRQRRQFGGFDDFFSSGREAVYQTLVVPSNEPDLQVIPLPEKNKPKSFSGLVGEYSISVSAEPTEANIGDPITLSVSISGPNAAHAYLPDLTPFLPPSSFKIPKDIAPGEGNNDHVSFTQTIRVKNPLVKEIPAIELVYFDPEKASYQTAKSTPIPLIVHATKVVTAMDAEGNDPTIAQTRLEAAQKGLAFNFEGQDLLRDSKEQGIASTYIWLLLAVPPLLFTLFAVLSFFTKRKQRNPTLRRAKMAQNNFKKDLSKPSLSTQMLSRALKEYLGAKLIKNPGALTFLDVEPHLRTLGIDNETISQLADLLDRCEAFRYAGQVMSRDTIEDMKKKAIEVVRQLEPYFK